MRDSPARQWIRERGKDGHTFDASNLVYDAMCLLRIAQQRLIYDTWMNTRDEAKRAHEETMQLMTDSMAAVDKLLSETNGYAMARLMQKEQTRNAHCALAQVAAFIRNSDNPGDDREKIEGSLKKLVERIESGTLVDAPF